VVVPATVVVAAAEVPEVAEVEAEAEAEEELMTLAPVSMTVLSAALPMCLALLTWIALRVSSPPCGVCRSQVCPN